MNDAEYVKGYRLEDGTQILMVATGDMDKGEIDHFSISLTKGKITSYEQIEEITEKSIPGLFHMGYLKFFMKKIEDNHFKIMKQGEAIFGKEANDEV